MFFPIEQDLRNATEDVAHEILLFAVARDHLFVAASRDGPNRFVYQAWYLLARNLMDLFDTLPENRGDADGVLAGDFFGQPLAWRDRRDQIPVPRDYAEYRTAAHKRAAHLTYGRARYRRPGPEGYEPSPEVSEYLLRLATLFFNTVSPEWRERFRETEFWPDLESLLDLV